MRNEQYYGIGRMIFKNGWIVEGQFTADDEISWRRRIYNGFDSYVGWWKPSVGNYGFGRKKGEFSKLKGLWKNSKDVKQHESSFFGFFKSKENLPKHEEYFKVSNYVIK